MKDKRIHLVFDFDGVICPNQYTNGKPRDYVNIEPYPFAIEHINYLYDSGRYYIKIVTARYDIAAPGRQYQRGFEEATNWLTKHGVKYHELYFSKPFATLYVDDKAFRVQSEKGEEDWTKLFEELGENALV